MKFIQFFFPLLTEMRQVGSSRGAVTAYPRQLESLIRLAEAHARMRLSSKVENVDVEEARRYVKIGQSHIQGQLVLVGDIFHFILVAKWSVYFAQLLG